MFPVLMALLAIRVGPAADAPAREPQMAVEGSTVALTFGAKNTIYFGVSHDSGKTFSAPVKVAESAVVPLTRHRGPRIAFAGKAIVITAVVGKTEASGAHSHGLPSDGDLLIWRSTDGGKTWSAGKPINDVPAAATEGLHALASNGNGALFAVWLDKRGANGTRLYAARSSDGGATWSKNVPVYESPGGTICECCHPSAAIDQQGRVVVMWRNSLDGSRDMYLSVSADGTTFPTPSKLGKGTWKINACPMDGGGLAVSGGQILTAWRRDGDLFMDVPGQPEQQIGTGKDVALAVSGGHRYAVWEDGPKIQSWRDGQMQVLSETGTFPSLCALPEGGVLAAWEQDGAIEFRRLP
jgi:BNR repeat-like domain